MVDIQRNKTRNDIDTSGKINIGLQQTIAILGTIYIRRRFKEAFPSSLI